MSAPVKIQAAKRQGGAQVLRHMLSAAHNVNEGRESMHWTHKRYGGLHTMWLTDYRYTKLAIEHLRAWRLLYDKLPTYAK